MSKLYALGFFLIAGGAFGAIDYNQQAMNAGETLQSYGVGRYAETRLGSVGGIFTGALEAKRLKQRQAKPASVHLPEAPEGWTRRDWRDTDKAVFLPYSDFSMSDPDPENPPKFNYIELAETYPALSLINLAQDENPDANFIEHSMRMPEDKMLHRDVFIYQKGEEFVALRATYDPRFDKPRPMMEWVMIGLAAQMGGTQRVKGYAYYDGVPFAKSKTIVNSEYIPNGIRVVASEISRKIKVEAWSAASDESVRDLLSRVDYAGLNAMLDEPVEGVADVPDLPLDEQLAQSSEILTVKKKQELATALASVEKFKKNSKAAAGAGSILPGGLGGAAGHIGALQAMENMNQTQPADGDAAMNTADGPFGTLLDDMKTAPSDATPPAADAAAPRIPVNMPDYNPEKLHPVEQAIIKQGVRMAKLHGDTGNQDAARVMEMRRGIVKGGCVHDHDLNRVHCNDNAIAFRNARDQGGQTEVSDIAVKPDTTKVPAPVTFVAPTGLSQKERMALGIRLMSLGLKPNDIKVKQDGITPEAADEWSQARDGILPETHPAYALRMMEVSKGFAPGSCLELTNSKVYCEDAAKAMRIGLALQKVKTPTAEKSGDASGSGVKVNRLNSGSAKTASNGVIGKNCETQGAFKRCTTGN